MILLVRQSKNVEEELKNNYIKLKLFVPPEYVNKAIN